jgi:Uncharacterized protein conserved in bacteria
MTEAAFRRLALKMPGAVEGSHMGHADFRVGGKIFATCGFKKGFGVLMLTPEQQTGMVEDAPQTFIPAPGAWGKNGSTVVALAKITPDLLEPALRLAWQNRVQKTEKSKKKRGRG